VYTFIVHAVLVGVLIRIANGDPRVFALDELLHVFHFWVYKWVMPLFNRPELGPAIGALNNLLGVSLRTFDQLYEWCFLVLFGGPAYVVGAVTAASWMRRRRVQHAVV
jgi:hypothetical protein